jgi:hypothetical protein
MTRSLRVRIDTLSNKHIKRVSEFLTACSEIIAFVPLNRHKGLRMLKRVQRTLAHIAK